MELAACAIISIPLEIVPDCRIIDTDCMNRNDTPSGMKHKTTKLINRIRMQAAAIGVRINRIPEGAPETIQLAQAEAALGACQDILQKAIEALDRKRRVKLAAYDPDGHDPGG